MKIFIIGPAFPLRGGLATFDELFCRALNEAGHQASIISFSLQYPSVLFPGTSQYDKTGNPPQDIEIHTLINSVNPYSWLSTGKFIQQSKPDLLIFRFWIPFMAPALGTIAKMARKKKIKVIAITDNVIPHEKRPGDKVLTKYFISKCQGFVTMSEAVMNDLSQFTKSPHKKFLKHPLYTSFGEIISKKEARTRLSLPENEKIILFFGLIRKYKGLDLLLEALSGEQLKEMNVKLIIAGEFYDDKNYYERLIKELNLVDRIYLHAGFIPNEEIKNYFCASNLVTLTYRSATQSGVTQVAFHFEKPVVVTNVGGLSEIIPNDIAGYVAEPNPSDIENKIADYFKLNKEEEFTAGMKKEKEKYDWKLFVHEVIRLAEQIPN